MKSYITLFCCTETKFVVDKLSNPNRDEAAIIKSLFGIIPTDEILAEISEDHTKELSYKCLLFCRP
mgnify:CR=1 FL=1